MCKYKDMDAKIEVFYNVNLGYPHASHTSRTMSALLCHISNPALINLISFLYILIVYLKYVLIDIVSLVLWS